jgi:hypothetical protein
LTSASRREWGVSCGYSMCSAYGSFKVVGVGRATCADDSKTPHDVCTGHLPTREGEQWGNSMRILRCITISSASRRDSRWHLQPSKNTLPEASSFSSSLTDPKAEHTLKTQKLDRDVPKGNVICKHKSESLEYTDPRVTAEKPNLPELQVAWTPARLGQTATQTFYCMSFASARVSEVLSVLGPAARSK